VSRKRPDKRRPKEPKPSRSDRTQSDEARWEFSDLFDQVATFLFRYDPVGLNFGSNPDEHDPETRTILPCLRETSSAEDVRRIVYEEFCHWFSPTIAGDEDEYTDIAKELWIAWLRWWR
jgi:hypothetical protein